MKIAAAADDNDVKQYLKLKMDHGMWVSIVELHTDTHPDGWMDSRLLMYSKMV